MTALICNPTAENFFKVPSYNKSIKKCSSFLLNDLWFYGRVLSRAIMTEVEERERINRELRDNVDSRLEAAREAVNIFKGQEAHKKLLDAQLTKFEALVSDKTRRLKSDTLRKLLESIEILINKTKVKSEQNDDASKSAENAEPTTSIEKPAVVTEPINKNLCTSDDTSNKSCPTGSQIELSKEKDLSDVIPTEKTVESPRVEQRISEEAKLRQRPQIPWRRPKRLEFIIESKVKKQEANFVQPLHNKEPERLALKYKIKKRPSSEPLTGAPPFKKPFPVPSVRDDTEHMPQKPLFHRRHQLSPSVVASYHNRDPRNFNNYCHRNTMQTQNQTRFQNQNRQYYRQPQQQPVRGVQPNAPRGGPPPQSNRSAQHSIQDPPHESTHHEATNTQQHRFAVPAPVPPTKPKPATKPIKPAISKKNAQQTNRESNAQEQSAPSTTSKIEIKKTINPVYSDNEPIRLGKKGNVKQTPASKTTTTTTTSDDNKKDKSSEVSEGKTNLTPEKATTSAVVGDEPVQNDKAEKPKKDKLSESDIMLLLKEIGDEKKVKQILEVMNRNSEGEEEDKNKTNKQKKMKKFKRIRAKLDESSSDEDAEKKDKNKNQKSKAAVISKKPTGAFREIMSLIENSSDFLSKGGELRQTRRRATNSRSISPTDKNSQNNSKEDINSSDETSVTPTKQQQEEEEDSLLTVAKSPTNKGKAKSKENSFIYNDKKTVHCNSTYLNNCALCSFNGSAIVDHYVYEHKQYEVFISRVAPKVADIIRSDPFMTNGTMLEVGTDSEKIRFKCLFCLVANEFNREAWAEHITSHTGEYRYRCTSCPVMSKTPELVSTFFHEKGCLKPSLAVYNNIEFQDNHMYGYMCNACNYVQIRRVNMERHLKREHPSVDVGCIRFSTVNYKIEMRPIIEDDDQLIAELLGKTSMPTVSIPRDPKPEPMETCEIVNQPFTEDDDINESDAALPLRRADIRMDSIHLTPSGSVVNEFGHKPFTFKMERELQANQVSSSERYESPRSPEAGAVINEPSEAEAIVPVMQIQSVHGGFDLKKVFVKREGNEEDCDSDASDKTTDFDMSDGAEEGRQCASNSQKSTENSETKSNAGNNGVEQTAGGSNSNGSQPTGASNSPSNGAGSGGDGDDERKRESFSLPIKIKKEKDSEENEEKDKSNESTEKSDQPVVVKQEKPDADTQPSKEPEEEYNFIELVLDSHRMEHVACVEHQSNMLFLCLIPGCQYITKESQNIVKHVSAKHSHLIWDGYCHPCQSQISIMDNCLISNELQHLLEVHGRRKTPVQLTVTPSTTQSILRIRKMPGDILSSTDSDPPPLAPVQLSAITPPSTPIISFPTAPIILQSMGSINVMPATSIPTNNVVMNSVNTVPPTMPPILQATPMILPKSTTIRISPATNSINTIVPVSSRVQHKIKLKPWSNSLCNKTEEHCQNMLEETSLICLYKCMASQCAYTTSRRYFMEQHLSLHETLHVDIPNGPPKSWLECAYCDLTFDGPTALLNHVETEHASCGFQCSLCFYRSRDPTNVVVHQKSYHSNSDDAKILINPENMRQFGDDEWRSMQESLRRNVLPLQCTICKESYYILSAYMSHLGSHQHTHINCQVCNLRVHKKDIAKHLLIHSIGYYECVYCPFGSNTKASMAQHISNMHSAKPMYCCIRCKTKHPDGQKYPPTQIGSMELKTMSCTISPELFKKFTYSPEQLNYKPIDIESNERLAYPGPPMPSAATFSSDEAQAVRPISNLQIRILDDAGRPLIVSIPVLNAPTKQSEGTDQPLQKSEPSVETPEPDSSTIQLPLITTVRGGVQDIDQTVSLPKIASVQGASPSAETRSEGLPIISNVQSIASIPDIESVSTSNSAVPKGPLKSIPLKPSAMVSIPNLLPAAIAESQTSSNAKDSISTSRDTSSPSLITPMSFASVKSISPMPSARKSSSNRGAAKASKDNNKTLKKSPKTNKSNNATKTTPHTPALSASQKSAVTAARSPAATTSKTPGVTTPQTPVVTAPADSTEASSSKDMNNIKAPNTKQIRIVFLFDGSVEKFDKVEKIINTRVKNTGLHECDLNICGVDDCNARFKDPVKLNLHLLKHNKLSKYTCYHCKETFTSAHALITHIKIHGRHRYLCFLCDQKSYFLKSLMIHLQQDHDCPDVTLTYLHPNKRDIHNDFVVVCPKNVTSEQLQNYIDTILNEKSATGKKVFTPDDIEELPPDEIFSENMFCASCVYSTKIRKNLKRHLERHLENPPRSDSTQPTQNSTVPQLVALDKRYQCGICNMYCEQKPDSFREHLSKEHRFEKYYKCQHCFKTFEDGYISPTKITNHAKLHGDTLYRCSDCELYSEEKSVIKDHITKWHKKSHVLIIREKISVNVAKLSHVSTARKNTTEIKNTNSTIGGKKKYSCGYKDCSYVGNVPELVKKHFLANHPNDTLVVYDDSVIKKEERERFDYFVRYICHHCKEENETVDGIVEHWYKNHKSSGDNKPLIFKLSKLVKCYYCPKISTYYNVRVHNMLCHAGQTFACVDHRNMFKCGECTYVLTGEKTDLLKHFKANHSIYKDPCDYIDDEFLCRLLEQNNSLYTCNICNLVFDTKFEYEGHVGDCASLEMPKSFILSTKSVRIRYFCSRCDEWFDNEYFVAKHIRNHLVLYCCRFCSQEFETLRHLNQHMLLIHNSHDTNYQQTDFTKYKQMFLEIKMLFPNGLLLSKLDAVQTVCGTVDDIISYVRKCNEEDIAQLVQQQALRINLVYRNKMGGLVETTCKRYLDLRPSMVLKLPKLTGSQIAEIIKKMKESMDNLEQNIVKLEPVELNLSEQNQSESEQNQSEQDQSEQDQSEQNLSEQNQPEQNQTEQNHLEQCSVEQDVEEQKTMVQELVEQNTMESQQDSIPQPATQVEQDPVEQESETPRKRPLRQRKYQKIIVSDTDDTDDEWQPQQKRKNRSLTNNVTPFTDDTTESSSDEGLVINFKRQRKS